MQEAILKQYDDVFSVLKNYEVWFIPGNVDDVDIMTYGFACFNPCLRLLIFVDSLLMSCRSISLVFNGIGTILFHIRFSNTSKLIAWELASGRIWTIIGGNECPECPRPSPRVPRFRSRRLGARRSTS